MLQMEFPILLSLVSALFGALNNILAKYVMGFARPKDYISVNFAVIFALMIPFAPFFFQLTPTPRAIILVIIASIVDSAANYFYFKSFEMTDASTASALLSLSPLFAMLILPLLRSFSLAYLKPLDIVGICAVVAGVIVLNMRIAHSKPQTAPHGVSKELLIPLCSSFFFGINVYLIKYILTARFVNPATYYFIRAFIIMLLMFLVLRPQFDWVNGERILIVSGRAVFVIGKWILLLYAVSLGNPPVVKAVSEVTPLFVLFLSFVFLSETIDRYKILGSASIVAGVVLISM